MQQWVHEKAEKFNHIKAAMPAAQSVGREFYCKVSESLIAEASSGGDIAIPEQRKLNTKNPVQAA